MSLFGKVSSIVLFLGLLSACQEAAPAEVAGGDPTTASPGEVLIQLAANASNQGQAAGPHRLSFTNYPASEILRRTVDGPLDYATDTDPSLTVDYYFPAQSLAEARPQVLRAIVDFLQLELDTVQRRHPVLVLSAPEFQPRQLPDRPEGVKTKAVDNTVYLYDASLAELAEQLRKYRSTFFVSVAADRCCTDISFPRTGPLPELSAALSASGGIQVDTTEELVPTLLISD